MIKEIHFFDIINVVKEKFKARKSNIKEVVSCNIINTNENLEISSEIGDLTASLNLLPPPPPPPTPPPKKIIIGKNIVQVIKEMKNVNTKVKVIDDELLHEDEVSAKSSNRW